MAGARKREVLTVGHSTHGLGELVGLVRGVGVGAVADVRAYPSSRRMPHFGREALERGLAEAGVGYEHFPELGGRRGPPRADSPNAGWEVAGFQAYADHMEDEEFALGLARLEELAAGRRTAVMCAEALWWRCHRRLVSDALLVRGWRVLHLGPDGSLTEHTLTPFAVVEKGGRLTYPPRQGSLGL